MNARLTTKRIPLRIPLPDDPDDFVGYEALIDFMKRRALCKLEGDIIEVGAYMGRGTAKLARFARRYGKAVYAIDVFDPGRDRTLSRSGVRAGDVYEAFLRGRSMLAAYQESTGGLDNVITITEDSKKVSFPPEQRFMFGFIDGCHEQSYVENDFRLIWPHLVSGGAVGFHDYEYADWPEVTKAAHKLMQAHMGEIKMVYEVEGKFNILSLLLVKR